MKNKFELTQVLKNGCVIFTVITVLSYIAGSLLSAENKAFIPTLKWVLLFLLFSLLLAFANLLLKNKRASVGIRLGLHFIASALLYFVCVVLCGGFISNGAQTLIAMTLFVLLYAVFAVIFAIISATGRIQKNKKEEYDSMFK